MLNSNQRPHILKFLEVFEEVNSLSKLKMQLHIELFKLNAFSTFKKEHSDLITGNISIDLFLQTVTKAHVLPLKPLYAEAFAAWTTPCCCVIT